MRALCLIISILLVGSFFACTKKRDRRIGRADASRLVRAVRDGDVERLEQLIYSGEYLNKKSRCGVPPVALAIGEGNMEMTRMLIDAGADLETTSRFGNTLVHVAVQNRQIEITRYLVGKGLSVNAVNKNGFTPLHNAARHGNVELTNFLLANGADPNASNRFKETPLHHAVVFQGNAAAEPLLQSGAKVDVQDHKENTPLHIAAAQNAEIVGLLLEHGAQANLLNKRGMTALAIANYFHKDSAAEVLRNNGGIVERIPVYVWKARSEIPIAGAAVYFFNEHEKNYVKIGDTDELGVVHFTELHGRIDHQFAVVVSGDNKVLNTASKRPKNSQIIEDQRFNHDHWPALRLEVALPAENDPID